MISLSMAEAIEGLSAMIPRTRRTCIAELCARVAYAFGRRAGTVCTPVTTDREAEHMQMAVVLLLAAKISGWATLARIVVTVSCLLKV